MAGEWAALVSGLAIGFSLAAPPGPVNALIAREASRRGPWAGFRAGVAAPIVDLTYLTLVLFGVQRLAFLHAIEPALAAVGAVLMLALAWAAVRAPRAGEVERELGFGAVLAVSLTNPFQYAWWISAGAILLVGGGPWTIAGFAVAIFGWVATFSYLVWRGAQRWGWFSPLLVLVSADVLVAFAFQLALTASAGF
jgi:threonine/homoserine/homoserine lactone efflux protein